MGHYLNVFISVVSSRIADAEENLGESEVREAHLAKSLFYIRIGDKVHTITLRFPVLFIYLNLLYIVLISGKGTGTT